MHGFETMFLPVTQHIKGALSSCYERLKRKGLTGAAYFLPLSSLIHARRCMAWHDLPASPARMHGVFRLFWARIWRISKGHRDGLDSWQHCAR
jgi:hypothetical protein